MSKADAVRGLTGTTVETVRTLDILVNNAGIQFTAPMEEFPAAKWHAILDINLSAAFHGIAAAVPQMKKQHWGRIVNIASTHGLVASTHKAAYVAAKHGLVGLTKVVGLETAGSGVTCNAICPGWVRTPLEADRRHRCAEEHQPEGSSQVPAGREAAVPRFRLARAARRHGRLPVLGCRGPDHRDGDLRRRRLDRAIAGASQQHPWRSCGCAKDARASRWSISTPARLARAASR
ncbi:SDR family NAD(P)-dependent oxidoreductase [Bradyrhizobium neotropicale]|uniref:SDR family NAD(P)-dependent oxidoreductase n=1 Tax=Bradyrhizobium neotropicale TaxID=1497615 RepID=UPI000A5D4917